MAVCVLDSQVRRNRLVARSAISMIFGVGRKNLVQLSYLMNDASSLVVRVTLAGCDRCLVG